MAKNRAHKIIIPIMLILLIIQAVSGMLHERLVGELFEHIHVPVGLLLLVLGIVHLALNWHWVKANYGKPAAKRTAATPKG